MASIITVENTIVKLTILGMGEFEIVALSDDADALMFGDVEWLQQTTGALGDVIIYTTGEKGCDLTIKLLANSSSVPRPMGLLVSANQNADPKECIITIDNPSVKFSHRLEGVYLMGGPPAHTLGKGNVANLNYRFHAEKITSVLDAMKTTGRRASER